MWEREFPPGLTVNEHPAGWLFNRENLALRENNSPSSCVSPAAVAVSLKKLENGGYIKREPSEEDGRFNKTVITEAGLEVLERGKKVFSEVDRQSLDGFSPEEKKTLDSYIMRISDNLSELLGKDFDI